MRILSVASKLAAVLTAFVLVSVLSPVPASAATTYSSHLRRYPYLTDVVSSYATVNWGTDRYYSTAAVRWGQVGTESCTAHYAIASRAAIAVNGVGEYQWKATLNVLPDTQYCYRVYLGSSPSTEIDLLGSDSSPKFRTQVPAGSTQSYSFAVFGDWGYTDSTGTNPSQANVISLVAGSGARFAVTTGDNSYMSATQTNFGDLVQTGSNISNVFGPSFWKVAGSFLPLFPASGNHGYTSSANVPLLVNFPQARAVSLSGGKYVKQTYCCLDGTSSGSYPTVYYAFDAGLARIYVLDTAWSDTNVGTATPYQVDHDYKWTTTSAEYQWLKADLASHPSALKFAVFHYPPYTDSGDPTETSDTFLRGSSSLEGLLAQYGVDIVFNGHAHLYERNNASPLGLLTYVTGGGGALLGPLGTCTSIDAYAMSYTSKARACGSAPLPTSAAQVYHFLKVTINGTQVTVTPTNSLGNTFDVQTYNFSGSDTTAPSVPGGLAAVGSGGTQAKVSWSASSDNVAVRGYDVYRNGVLVATTDASTLTYLDTGLAPGTTYNYTVDAFDGAGNHSAQSPSDPAVTSKTASYTFVPVADAYVSSVYPTTNYGTSTVLKAQSGSPTTTSYLRFNVNGIVGSITKATLRLYTSTSSATGYQLRSVSDNTWEENQVTYNNAPGFGSVVSTSGSFASNAWVSVDVTSLITGTGVFNFAVTTASTSNMSFRSRDAASNQPQLIVQTSVP